MANSTQNVLSVGGGEKRRPSTPYPSSKVFDFDDSPESPTIRRQFLRALDAAASGGSDFSSKSSPGVCIGISLATVISTFRDPSLKNPQSPTPKSDCNCKGDNFLQRLNRLRSTVQRTLTCASNIDGLTGSDDFHVRYDYDESYDTERDKSLMARAASWGTLETEIVDSTSKDNHQVQFQYPPVTSVRLRPRTESDEINLLFFAPEELDEIEDDRFDTRATDDVETLAVGEIRSSTTSSAASTFDYDDQDSSSALMIAGSGYSKVVRSPKQATSPRQSVSPRKNERSSGGKRLIRGVQIMLREKSTRADYYR
jgi:hypothetical protein